MPTAGTPPGKPSAIPYADLIRQAFLTHFAASLVRVDRKIHGFLGRRCDTVAISCPEFQGTLIAFYSNLTFGCSPDNVIRQ